MYRFKERTSLYEVCMWRCAYVGVHVMVCMWRCACGGVHDGVHVEGAYVCMWRCACRGVHMMVCM